MHGVPRAGGHTVGLGWPRCPLSRSSRWALGSLTFWAAGTPFAALPADPARPAQNSGPQCGGACPADSPVRSPLPRQRVSSQPSLSSFPLRAAGGLERGHAHAEHLVMAWPPPRAPAGRPRPSSVRRRCVKASLSALYKVVGHAAVLLTAAGRCYYPLPARRSRWRTPGPGIIVLLGCKLPLPAGPFA